MGVIEQKAESMHFNMTSLILALVYLVCFSSHVESKEHTYTKKEDDSQGQKTTDEGSPLGSSDSKKSKPWGSPLGTDDKNYILVKTEGAKPFIKHVAGDDKKGNGKWKGFHDVLEVLPKEQYNWFKSLDKDQKQLLKQILSDEFKYDRKVVDRHCSPFSKLLKAARNGKVETIIKTKLEKL